MTDAGYSDINLKVPFSVKFLLPSGNLSVILVVVNTSSTYSDS